MNIPYADKSLIERIKVVRRDVGNLLFHFTRAPDKIVDVQSNSIDDNALIILRKILGEGKLLGSSKWIRNNSKCICFTEAPIHEFAALFSLIKIAADKKQRPRYEPYGIAVKKDWLYRKGGRPVIYDNEKTYNDLPKSLQHRHVTFNPQKGVDCTWEREWRICSDELILEPEHTLAIVPDAKTAFDIGYFYSEENLITYSTEEKTIKVEEHQESDITGSEGEDKILDRRPKWMAVSLDLFDINPA